MPKIPTFILKEGAFLFIQLWVLNESNVPSLSKYLLDSITQGEPHH